MRCIVLPKAELATATTRNLCLQYTISGKKVEIAVTRILAGQDITHRGTFRNPNSLDLYKNIERLSDF